jgi:hypothetical protein
VAVASPSSSSSNGNGNSNSSENKRGAKRKAENENDNNTTSSSANPTRNGHSKVDSKNSDDNGGGAWDSDGNPSDERMAVQLAKQFDLERQAEKKAAKQRRLEKKKAAATWVYHNQTSLLPHYQRFPCYHSH